MPKGLVLNVDTTKSEFQNPMVELRQGDGNYQSLYVTVTDNGDPFDLTGWTVSFMGTTAGSHKIVDVNVVLDSNVVGAFTYTPTKSWGQDEGEFKNAYFKFVKSDETASGASFRVNVLNAVDLTAEEAGNYISVVDAMIDQVKTDMDTKLSETKQTLTDTQTQANTVQTNVNDLNTNVNDLKAQNNNIRTDDNNWTGINTFNKKIIAPAGVQGNADTATKLQTARLIGGIDFDGTSDITLAGVNAKGNQDTSGRAANATNADLAMKAVALQTPRKINGTDFDGTADINVNADNDGSLVHKTGNETVVGDKSFTGTTLLNNIGSLAVSVNTLNQSGFSMTFVESAVGVNVSISGQSASGTADGVWRNIGVLPSSVTKPMVSMYTTSSVWSSVGGVTNRSGFSVCISFSDSGNVSVKIDSMRENDNSNYNIQFAYNSSVTWVK